MQLEEQDKQIFQPLLKDKQIRSSKLFPKLQNKKRNKSQFLNQQAYQYKKSLLYAQDRINQSPQIVSEQVINSLSEMIKDSGVHHLKNDSTISQKKSIKVQFNKKRRQQRKNQQNLKTKIQQKIKIEKKNFSQSVYAKIQLQGLRIKTNWLIPIKSKTKSFNSQIMNIDERVLRFLYYMNFILNGIFRLSLLSILILMIIYHQEYKLMEMIVIMEVVAVFLYCLAMIKMLYTKKDEESIYFQKKFTDRDITDIEMDRVLRKHFTWRNILKNISSYFKLNSKFKDDIKISILRQEIFKRMQLVLCFIPFTVIFFTTPSIFKFQCDYPVQIIVTATICMEFVRTTVHYIVIFIQN